MSGLDDHILVPANPPNPLPTRLRTNLTSALLSSSAIPNIQSTLHSTSQDLGWIEAVHQRAKQLISSGQATTSKEAVDMLVTEAMAQNNKKETNLRGGLVGKNQLQERDGGRVRGVGDDKIIDVRFPEEAARRGKEVVREALEDIVDVETL
ncbi:MAG: hypothetical protein Q9169_001058 [Polycauliona sp. 2 TL-2023]